MGNSLQDQLLKSGLGNRKQAVKARKAKNHKEKLQRHGKDVVDEATELARRADEEKKARDLALNRQQQAEREQKALQAQIRQLIDMNRIEDRGEVEFSFTDGSRIRTLMLTESARSAVIKGALAVVRLPGTTQGNEARYELIPRQVANKIAERDASDIIISNRANESDEIDEAYAGYEVPDDLMW